MSKIMTVIVFLSSMILAQNFSYVGSNKCKMCHNKTEKGSQYSIWEASAHAKSFETLKSDLAIKIAQENGLTTDPWNTAVCVKCHTTGFNDGGYEIMNESFWSPIEDDRDGIKAVKRMKALQSVGCESCHGAGSKYKSSKIMKGIFAGEVDGATVGLMEPNEETCIVCHNENSPTYKPFEFKERFEKIAHPMP